LTSDADDDEVYIYTTTDQVRTGPKRALENDFVSSPEPISTSAEVGSASAAICVNCGVSFNIGSTAPCQHHDGDLETDYDDDCRADHDERCHGQIDGDFCKVHYPDNYAWTCCEKDGNYKGCRLARCHEPHGSRTDQAGLVLAGLKMTEDNRIRDCGTSVSLQEHKEAEDEETDSDESGEGSD
jgi:hypothetical protein